MVRTFVCCHSCEDTGVRGDGMRAGRGIADEVRTTVNNRAVRTSPSALTA